MEREVIKNELLKYYKPLTVVRILQGVRKPRYEVMVDLHKNGVIPFDAWLDIKSYLNSNEQSAKTSNTKESEKVLRESDAAVHRHG